MMDEVIERIYFYVECLKQQGTEVHCLTDEVMEALRFHQIMPNYVAAMIAKECGLGVEDLNFMITGN